jgi:sigma-B regulation protein RsbU (phosphoserine phosphatase)
VIGDVTGHGVPAAMITATAKAACDVARSVYGEQLGVAKLLETMNTAIFHSARRRLLMSCFAAIIDPKTGTMEFSNAGHNFPYILRDGKLSSVIARGSRLGDLDGSTYEVKTTKLEAGDVIVLYTDGVTESESESGELYSDRRFRHSIERNGELSAANLRDILISELDAHCGMVGRRDDITLVVGRIT